MSREGRRFERARSRDRAAYSSGKNGWLAGWEDAGVGAGGGGGGPGGRDVSPEGQLRSGERGCGGRRLAGAAGPEGGGGPLARGCCCFPSPFFFLKEEILRLGINIGQANRKRDLGKLLLILRK